MKEYGRPYNTHEDGLYVRIYPVAIDIYSKMYSDNIEMELYYDEVIIDESRMDVIVKKDKKVIANIQHAKRIWDMR